MTAAMAANALAVVGGGGGGEGARVVSVGSPVVSAPLVITGDLDRKI